MSENADVVADVSAMHRGFFGSLRDAVAAMDPESRRRFWQFRLDFLREELDELGRATTGEDALDALVDLVVVAVGTADAFGADFAEAWRRVHAANAAKRVGANPRRSNPFGLPDLVKPEGWMRPDHRGLAGMIGELFEENRDDEETSTVQGDDRV